MLPFYIRSLHRTLPTVTRTSRLPGNPLTDSATPPRTNRNFSSVHGPNLTLERDLPARSAGLRVCLAAVQPTWPVVLVEDALAASFSIQSVAYILYHILSSLHASLARPPGPLHRPQRLAGEPCRCTSSVCTCRSHHRTHFGGGSRSTSPSNHTPQRQRRQRPSASTSACSRAARFYVWSRRHFQPA